MTEIIVRFPKSFLLVVMAALMSLPILGGYLRHADTAGDQVAVPEPSLRLARDPNVINSFFLGGSTYRQRNPYYYEPRLNQFLLQGRVPSNLFDVYPFIDFSQPLVLRDEPGYTSIRLTLDEPIVVRRNETVFLKIRVDQSGIILVSTEPKDVLEGAGIGTFSINGTEAGIVWHSTGK